MMPPKEREASRLRRDDANRRRHTFLSDLEVVSDAWEDVFLELALLECDTQEVEEALYPSYERARAALVRLKALA